METFYVFGEWPVTSDGIIAPVMAANADAAVAEAEKMLNTKFALLPERFDGDALYRTADGRTLRFFGSKSFTNRKPILFPLGRVVATPGAIRKLEENQAVSLDLLYRHQTGDWGVVDAHDQRANVNALRDGSRILSAFLLKDNTKIWVITEAVNDGNRASTCILLPDEY